MGDGVLLIYEKGGENLPPPTDVGLRHSFNTLSPSPLKLLITPGQTTNVLLKTKSDAPNANFYMIARPYVTGLGTFDNSSVAGILEYESSSGSLKTLPIFKSDLPALNDTSFATNFSSKLRSLASSEFPANVPQKVGQQFFFTVELIIQDTSILGAESHPLQLHGFNFFVIGKGFGNFDPKSDPKKFNLVDPGERNTVGVPAGGWAAIRFRADNPGVWFMHCQLEIHTSWGLRMAWIVQDGRLPDHKILPPPADLPKC